MTRTPPRIYRGLEEVTGTTRRDRRQHKVIAIELTNAERCFLRHGLRDISRVAEAVYHHPPPGTFISPWTREGVVRRVSVLREVLGSGKLGVLVITDLDKSIVSYAIEHNDYFAAMRDGDPRLCPDGVRQANALRERVGKQIGRGLRPVPLGRGRTRIAEGVAA